MSFSLGADINHNFIMILRLAVSFVLFFPFRFISHHFAPFILNTRSACGLLLFILSFCLKWRCRQKYMLLNRMNYELLIIYLFILNLNIFATINVKTKMKFKFLKHLILFSSSRVISEKPVLGGHFEFLRPNQKYIFLN